MLISSLILALEIGIDYYRENIPTSAKLRLVIPNTIATKIVYPIILAAYNLSTLFSISTIYPSYILLYYILIFLHSN